MSTPWGRGLQLTATALLVAAYAGVLHYANCTAAHELGTTLVFGPLALIAVIHAWRETPPWVAGLLTAALAGFLYAIWPALTRNYAVFCLLEQSSIYALLGITFGRSLLRHRTALCTRLADELHGPLSPLEVRYTRQVTSAWTLFFFSISAASILLYLGAPLRVWSFCVNFCVLPLIGAMFVAEFLVRRRVLPRKAGAGLMATLRVYFHSPGP